MSYSFSGLTAATYGNVTDGTGGTTASLISARVSADGEYYTTIYSGSTEVMLLGGGKMLFPIYDETVASTIETGNPIGLLLSLTYTT